MVIDKFDELEGMYRIKNTWSEQERVNVHKDALDATLDKKNHVEFASFWPVVVRDYMLANNVNDGTFVVDPKREMAGETVEEVKVKTGEDFKGMMAMGANKKTGRDHFQVMGNRGKQDKGQATKEDLAAK